MVFFKKKEALLRRQAGDQLLSEYRSELKSLPGEEALEMNLLTAPLQQTLEGAKQIMCQKSVYSYRIHHVNNAEIPLKSIFEQFNFKDVPYV